METPRNVERRKYGYEQLEFVRILIQQHKCTARMIQDLTGVPEGSLGGFAKQLDVPRGAGIQRSPGNNITKIREARTLAILRTEYGDQISRLFGKDKSSNTVD